MSSSEFLPYGRQEISPDDVAAVTAALQSDLLTQGPLIGRFEAEFATAVGARHAVACNSGTAALHLVMMALGIGPGDSVVVPAVTFLATANAARFCGAEVVFADVDPRTGLITPETAAAACARAAARAPDRPVRAIVCVHLNGWCADLPGLRALAAARGAALVEDACHALGSRHAGPDGRAVPVGACALSDLAVFSLHPVKTATMGEGGVVTTNHDRFAAIAARNRNHGMTRDPAEFEHPDLALDASGTANPWYYEMLDLGWNYRATELQAALGLSQLARLDSFATRRRRVAARYDAMLKRLAPLLVPVPGLPGCEPCLHLYAVHLDYAGIGKSRTEVMHHLRDLGIGTQVHYQPVHLQPYYVRRYGAQHLPGAEAYYRSILSIPLFPAMTDGDIDRVVTALAGLLGA